MILCVGALLRLVYVDSHSLWIDEYITLSRAVLPLQDIVRALFFQGPADLTPDYSPPLYHLLLGVSLQFGHTDMMARLPGIVFSVATIFLLWRIGTVMFSGRVGIFAALIFSLSDYMIHYSRNIRPYGVVLFLLLLAMHCSYQGLRTGKRGYWVGYALASAASMWMLLTSLGNMGGICLAVGLQAAWAWLATRSNAAFRPVLACSAATLAACLTYLPWLPAHNLVVRISVLDFPPTGVSTITWAGFCDAYSQFIDYFGAPDWLKGATLGVALLGIAAAVYRKRTSPLVFLALWALFPLAIFLFMDISYPFFSRRIITAYFLLIFCIALGIEALISWTTVLWRQAPLVVGLALSLVLSSSSVRNIPVFYSSALSEYKDAMLHVFLEKKNTRFFYSPDKLQDFLREWYLPGEFEALGEKHGVGYMRVFAAWGKRAEVVADSGQARIAPFQYFNGPGQFDRLGIVNRSPLAASADSQGRYTFSTSFQGFDVFRDASDWANITVHPQADELVVGKRGRPGFVTFRFDANAESLAGEIGVRLGVRLTRFLDFKTDDAVLVWVGLDGDAPTLAGRIDSSDFDGQSEGLAAEVVREFSLPCMSARSASITLELQSGFNRSSLAVNQFAASFSLVGASPGSPATKELQAVWRNTRLIRWGQGPAQPHGDGLHAFAVAESTQDKPWLGTPAERARYLALHPGATPVHVIFEGDRPLFEFYDPYLHDDFISIADATPQKYLASTFSQPADGLTTRGEVHFPRLDINGVVHELPWHFPAGALTMIRPDNAEGLMLFRPLYARQAFDPSQFAASDSIIQNGQESCLRCKDGTDCQATYFFHSTAPLTALRLSYVPRVFNDSLRNNRVAVSYSFDQQTYFPLDELRSNGSGSWSELSRQRTLTIPLEKPEHRVWLRFDLSSENCQIWSTPHAPCIVTAKIDPHRLPLTALWDAEMTIAPLLQTPNNFSLSFRAPPLRLVQTLVQKQ